METRFAAGIPFITGGSGFGNAGDAFRIKTSGRSKSAQFFEVTLLIHTATSLSVQQTRSATMLFIPMNSVGSTRLGYRNTLLFTFPIEKVTMTSLTSSLLFLFAQSRRSAQSQL
jgi:hypothetical protein